MNILKNKYLQFSLLLIANIVIFCIVAQLLQMRFEENDDIFMCLIANGNYSGTPDCHLVFQNALWGWLVSGLYRLTDAIEWYSVLFTIIHVVSMSIIAYYMIERYRTNKLLLTFNLICIYSLWIVIIQSFQFTTTAGILCAAGCVMLTKETKAPIFFGCFVILIASLVRIEAAALVGLLAAPFLLLTYKKNWQKYVRLIVVSVLVLTAIVIDRQFYSSSDWKEYYEYNKLRGDINDNPNINAIGKDEIEQIGITKDDYAMLCGFMPDPEIITLPVMRQIHSSIKNIPLKIKIINIKQLVKYRIPLVILCLFTIFMVLGTGEKIDRLIIVFWFIWLCFLLSGLSIEHILKNRVFLCALFAIVVFMALVCQQLSFSKEWIQIAICACLLGLSGKYIYQCYKVNDLREEKISLWNEQRPLLEEVPANAYVMDMSSSPIESISPFDVRDFHAHLYPSGWLTLLPLNKEVGYSHRCLAEPNVYVLESEESSHERICDYLATKYGLHTIAKKITQNEQYTIIQIQRIGL